MTTPPTTAVTLRAGTSEDAGAVLALFDEAVAWLVERGRSDQWGSDSFSAREPGREMVDRFSRSDGFVVAVDGVGTPDERVVGALVVEAEPSSYIEPASEPERFVRLLITSRREKGRDIGGLLVERARAVCRRDGVALLRVDCFGGGEQRLVRWYESQGFVRSATVDVNGWPCQVLEQRVR